MLLWRFLYYIHRVSWMGLLVLPVAVLSNADQETILHNLS
jgi:hypothetical protein